MKAGPLPLYVREGTAPGRIEYNLNISVIFTCYKIILIHKDKFNIASYGLNVEGTISLFSLDIFYGFVFFLEIM